MPDPFKTLSQSRPDAEALFDLLHQLTTMAVGENYGLMVEGVSQIDPDGLKALVVVMAVMLSPESVQLTRTEFMQDVFGGNGGAANA